MHPVAQGESHLLRLIESGTIPHALLLSGPRGVDLKGAACRFAVQLLGTRKHPEHHPDIHHSFPEGKIGMHSLHSIRALATEAYLASYESSWKVFILHDIDRCLPTSSNALLKIIEEPPHHTVILLLTVYPDRVLPTLVSRCHAVYFPPGVDRASGDDTLLEMLATGITREKLALLESAQPALLFETILLWYRDRYVQETEGGETYLSFPQYAAQTKKISLLPLEEVERRVKQAQLAYERATKLSTCLEMLLLDLQRLASIISL